MLVAWNILLSKISLSRILEQETNKIIENNELSLPNLYITVY